MNHTKIFVGSCLLFIGTMCGVAQIGAPPTIIAGGKGGGGAQTNILTSNILQSGATLNQVIAWNGTQWAPASISSLGGGGIVVAGTNGISVVTNGTLYTINFNGAQPLLYGATNYGVTSFGTNAIQGMLTVDGYGQLTQYSTNAGILKLYNASTNVFVTLDGSTGNGTFAGLLTGTNGVASYNGNLAAWTTISVGSSAFSYTNTSGAEQLVAINANGATTTVTGNATTIYSSLATSDKMLILQPNEYTTVTYSVATPQMFSHPF